MSRSPPPDSNLVERREILDQTGIARALRRMAYEMVERNAVGQQPLYLIGVRTGGAFLAQRLVALMSDPRESHAAPPPLLGAVDITLYRDDVFHGLPKPDRRELPIHPDYVGIEVQTTASESVRVMLKERGETDRVVLRERRA
jgi:pyrimidine operon attenuation protein/uracil phosphoribosyltransferase